MGSGHSHNALLKRMAQLEPYCHKPQNTMNKMLCNEYNRYKALYENKYTKPLGEDVLKRVEKWKKSGSIDIGDKSPLLSFGRRRRRSRRNSRKSRSRRRRRKRRSRKHR